MQIQPYLYFDGRCDEAVAFYQTTIGAKPGPVFRFKDSPGPAPHSADPEKIMHTSFRVGNTEVLASDGHCKNNPEFKGFSLSLTAESPDQVTQFFNALSDGATIQMPLTKTFFSERFGMLTDKFGVTWMIRVAQ